MAVERPDQVWSTDTTYVPLASGFMYLAAILDWFSRYVLCWRLSNTLDGSFCLEMLEEALGRGRPEFFNTDQGVQFTSQAWTGRVESAGVAVSMDGRGRCLDNVFVERLWRSVKYEDVYLHGYEVVPELQRGLGRYFTFYNENDRTSRWRGGRPGKCTGADAALAIRERRSCSHRKPSAPVKGLRCEQERLGREDRWGVGMWNWIHTRYCTEGMQFFGLDNGVHHKPSRCQPTGSGLQLASQTLAQGGPQRRQPFPLCLVPSRVALRPSGHLGNSDRTTSGVSPKRACKVCSALQTIRIATQNAQRRPFRPHNAPAGKEGARQELPNGVFQAVAIGCLGPTLPARPAADVRTFPLRTSHASLRALAFCGRNT